MNVCFRSIYIGIMYYLWDRYDTVTASWASASGNSRKKVEKRCYVGERSVDIPGQWFHCSGSNSLSLFFFTYCLSFFPWVCHSCGNYRNRRRGQKKKDGHGRIKVTTSSTSKSSFSPAKHLPTTAIWNSDREAKQDLFSK